MKKVLPESPGYLTNFAFTNLTSNYIRWYCL